MTVYCQLCGKAIEKPIHQSVSHYLTRRFCSVSCASKSRHTRTATEQALRTAHEALARECALVKRLLREDARLIAKHRGILAETAADLRAQRVSKIDLAIRIEQFLA